ncbi:hypothetical protein [Arcticibacter eurypsychrophilus]|uniref:hypothetical protein n=1 Tax=Arcticibacter eurypsychrophilus TaxID=1434752 RepID=UPI0014817FC0|nr:hypothetical protein [Arcticibacter eurypsychrophilus]
MINDNIYKTYVFTDRNTNHWIHQLTVKKTPGIHELVKLTIQELTEKHSLPEQDIIVE